MSKLAGGAQAGRAASAEKQLEKMREEGLIEKPFVAKRRSFTFPSAERMGQRVLEIDDLTHGYQDRTLFKHAQLELEKGDRVAIIGISSLSAEFVPLTFPLALLLRSGICTLHLQRAFVYHCYLQVNNSVVTLK